MKSTFLFVVFFAFTANGQEILLGSSEIKDDWCNELLNQASFFELKIDDQLKLSTDERNYLDLGIETDLTDSTLANLGVKKIHDTIRNHSIIHIPAKILLRINEGDELKDKILPIQVYVVTADDRISFESKYADFLGLLNIMTEYNYAFYDFNPKAGDECKCISWLGKHSHEAFSCRWIPRMSTSQVRSNNR